MRSESTGVHLESFRKNIAIKFNDKCSINTFFEKKLNIYDVVTLKTEFINVEITSFLSIHNINDYYGKDCFQTSIFVLSLFKGLNTKALCCTGVSYTT